MRLVVLSILAPVSAKTKMTTPSYEGFGFCAYKRWACCGQHFGNGFIENENDYVASDASSQTPPNGRHSQIASEGLTAPQPGRCERPVHVYSSQANRRAIPAGESIIPKTQSTERTCDWDNFAVVEAP